MMDEEMVNRGFAFSLIGVTANKLTYINSIFSLLKSQIEYQ